MIRVLRLGAMVLGGLLLAIQLVPYGRDHSNPPVTKEAPWADEEGRRLAVAACYDCHSNETDWPWYSFVAPMSWLVQRDVERGRDDLNFSEWDRSQDDGDDMAEAVADGSMPPRNYQLLHAGARLSDDEKAALLRALGQLPEAGDDEDDGGGGGGDRSGSNRGPG